MVCTQGSWVVKAKFHVRSVTLSCGQQDAPVQAQVRQALARPRMAHALRPSAASSQRIIGDLRSTKWSTRREERYRILSSHRTGLSTPTEPHSPQTDASESAEETGKEQDKRWALGEIQVVDLVHEDAEEQHKSTKVSLILMELCNDELHV